jgi:hypothetical protein
MPRRRIVVLLGIILLANITIYCRAIPYPFLWDDVPIIVNNPLMYGPITDGLSASQHDHQDPVLRHSVLRPVHDSWRPWLYLSYRLDAMLWGINASAMRIHNIILAAILLLLVWTLALRMELGQRAALAICAALALHPLMVEPTVYISARADLLMAVLSVAAILSAWPTSTQISRTHTLVKNLLAGMFVLLALLTKEAVIGIALAYVFMLWTKGYLHRRGIISIIAMFSATALWFVLRVILVSQNPTAERSALFGGLLDLPSIALRSLYIMIFPFDLSVGRIHDPSWRWLGWGLVLLYALLLVIALRRTVPDSWQRTTLALVAWIPITIGPAAVVVVLMNILADRYLILPLVGLLLFTGHLLCQILKQIPRWKIPAAILLSLFLCGWAYVTFRQIPVWQNPIKLHGHSARMAPNSPMAWYRYGTALAAVNRNAEALNALYISAKLDQHHTRTWNNIGALYIRQQQYANAEKALNNALKLGKGVNHQTNLARVYLLTDRQPQACKLLAQTLTDFPGWRPAIILQAQACLTDTNPAK